MDERIPLEFRLASLAVPRRREPDPLASAIGARVRALREESGLTLEKLAYESALGSKGYLSDIEKGLARPSVKSLQVLAKHLGVHLLDLVTFPDDDDRQRLIEKTRFLSASMTRKLLRELTERE